MYSYSAVIDLLLDLSQCSCATYGKMGLSGLVCKLTLHFRAKTWEMQVNINVDAWLQQ